MTFFEKDSQGYWQKNERLCITEYWMKSQWRKEKSKKESVKSLVRDDKVCYKGFMMQRNGIKRNIYEKNN